MVQMSFVYGRATFHTICLFNESNWTAQSFAVVVVLYKSMVMPVGTSVFLSYRPNACLKRRADGRTDCQTSRPTDRKTAYRVMNTNSKRLSYIYIRRVSGLSVCDSRGEAVFSEEADVTEDPRPISSPLFLIFFAH